MENNISYSELKIDQQAGAYLMSTAKWNMFLSIIGFVACGFLVLGGLSFLLLESVMNMFSANPLFAAMGGTLIGLLYLIFAGLYLIPCIFLYNFSTSMQKALRYGNQELVNPAFSNLRRYSKFVGILVIVCIGLSLLFALTMPFFVLANTL